MLRTSHKLGLLGLAWVATGTAAVLAAEPPSDLAAQVAQLQQRLQTQQQEINQLRGQQSENWLNERRAEEVKALVREVLSDADTRASLREDTLTGGYNKANGFFLASEDGTFLLKIGGQFQLRYIYNHRNQPAVGQDGDEAGFSLRRAKLWFTGNIADPKIGYKFTLLADRNSGNLGLEEAYVTYNFMPELQVMAGRFKTPLTREYLISSAKNMAVETSFVDSVFSGGYAEGVSLAYTQDVVRMTASINDGLGSGNTNTAVKDFYGDGVDYAVTGRVDVKLSGDWKQWEDLSSWSDEKEPALFLGAAAHYQQRETGDNDAANTTDVLRWTVDGSFKTGGFNIYSAIIGNHNHPENNDTQSSYGFVVQGGYFVIPDTLEPYARYEVFEPTSGPSVSLATVGANYYLRKHNAKFTLDVVIGLDPIPSVASTTSGSIGLLPDSGSNRNQIALRAAFQLAF